MRPAAVDAVTALGFSGLNAAEIAAIAPGLEAYADLVLRWQTIQNLVSRETLPVLWQRHMADSLQILPMVGVGKGHWLDFGSGAGFPALPIAIALKRSDMRFTLVEPNGRKAAFLRTVVRELGLSVEVIGKRIEALLECEIGDVDFVSARALAPLKVLCGQVERFWMPQTVGFFPKGREHGEELVESAALWHHDIVSRPSAIEEFGVVLEMRNLRRKSDRA